MSWRKSWSKQNIYGNGDGKCKKRQLSPEERSVWDDYLDLAHLSMSRGFICVAPDVGFTRAQLSKLLNTSEETLNCANSKLLSLGMIVLYDNDVIGIKNWHRYQSEYDRLKQYKDTEKGTPKGTQKSTQKSTPKGTPVDIDIDIDSRIKNRKRRVFTPPTLEEVSTYCKERSNGIDHNRFINHYQSAGWMRKGTRIVDWKACVRTWEDPSKKRKEFTPL